MKIVTLQKKKSLKESRKEDEDEGRNWLTPNIHVCCQPPSTDEMKSSHQSKHFRILKECLSGRSLCIDPEYNVLWRFDENSFKISCYNSVAAEVKGSMLQSISYHHYRLSTNPLLSLQAFSVDNCHIVSRFNSHGGGWGYNAGLIEAILFSSD
uniref:Uncharacterized protein n=1 Tax=Amphimedon queenslandica TaxID=400682 RepID=A0A1X7U6P2_AMPQE